jgi:Zn-dependent protease
VIQSGTLRVGRIGSIAIDVHFTFGLVLLWGAWLGWRNIGTIGGALYGVFAVLLLFACVLLHELAHGWQARAMGLTVRRVILLPIGGLAQLETPPSRANHELAIAFAGPLANLLLGAALAGILLIIDPAALANPQVEDLAFPRPSADGLIMYLLGANMLLFVFNMIPAFPMDGGRVLRAGLALFTDYLTATRFASWVGRVIAAAMFLLGTFGWLLFGQSPSLNLPIIILSAVVYGGAQSEEIFIQRRWALARVNVENVVSRSAEHLAPWEDISQSLLGRLFLHDRVMPVLVEGRLVGLLTYREARRHAGSSGSPTVAHAMRTVFPSLRLRDTLWIALQQMISARLGALPVVDGNEFHGMITLDEVNNAWKYTSRLR